MSKSAAVWRSMVAVTLLWAFAGISQETVKPPLVISTEEAAKRLLKYVDPEYPAAAKELTGRVDLELHIDKEGNVAGVEVISGTPALAAAAVAAFRKYKFKPYLAEGKPVEVISSAFAVF